MVDADADFRTAVCTLLQESGLLVEAVDAESEALALMGEEKSPDLLVLELDLLALNPFAFADQLRTQGQETPLIFTAANSDVETIVTALTYYAEDFVSKPRHPAELATRVKRVLLRTGPMQPDDLEHEIDNRLHVNFTRQYAVIDGRETALTPTENRILQALYRHRGEVLTPDFLLANAWEAGHAGSLESLWVHIRRLRNKIEPDPDAPIYVVTVRRQGYCLPTEVRTNEGA